MSEADSNFGSDASASSGGAAVADQSHDGQNDGGTGGDDAGETGEDAALSQILNKHGLNGQLPPSEVAQRDPANGRFQPKTNAPATPANKAAPQAQPNKDGQGNQNAIVSEPMSEEDQAVANRFQIRGDAAKALAAMPAATRAPFIQHLTRTAQWFDGQVQEMKQVRAERDELKKQLAAGPRVGAEMSELEKQEFEENTKMWGDDAAKHILAQSRRRDAARQTESQPQQQQEPQHQDRALQVMEQRDIVEGFRRLEEKAPDELKQKLADPATRKKIEQKAVSLFKSRIEPWMTRADVDNLISEYPLYVAIPEAAQILFPTDYERQAAVNLANQTRDQVRRTPDGRGRNGSTSTKKTQDEIETEAAEAALRRAGLPVPGR